MFDLQPHFVSACISPSISTFLIETKMNGERRMDYLFSSQSFKSLEKHQSPFKLSRILSRSRSRAQRSTIAYGSYIRPGVLGPLHLLVGLREQAENMMVICLLGSLSSHHTCSNKCLCYHDCCLRSLCRQYRSVVSPSSFCSCCSMLMS